jgi:hypothetical protein
MNAKLTRASDSCKYCFLLPCGSSYPLPPLPTGKVRALTPLAADWFRGVPSPYHPSLPLLFFYLLSPPSLSLTFACPIVLWLLPTSPPLLLHFCLCSWCLLPDSLLRLVCLLPLPCASCTRHLATEAVVVSEPQAELL